MRHTRVLAAAAAVLLLLVFLIMVRRGGQCATDVFLCADGSLVSRTGKHCNFDCPLDSTIKAEVLWNAPIHSWTGVASEAVDFLMPLSRRVPALGLVGGFVKEYVDELSEIDRSRLEDLRSRGAVVHEPTSELKAMRIFVTQYDPGTYKADYERHSLQNFDYRVGRAMFETTKVPSAWKAALPLMDEIWVPSRWGADKFVDAGMDRSKVFVVPEAIDTSHFDPDIVPRNRSLLPDSAGRFCFLSIFKWELRKGWDVLLTAFVTAFSAKDPVALYIRSGDPFTAKLDYEMLLVRLKVSTPPKVHFLPRVTLAEYAQLYRAADAFVLPTHAEGWGRPIMEAMAMGLPAIAPAWSGQTEFMTDRTSFLVPIAGLEEAFTDAPQIVHYERGHQWARLDPISFAKVMRYVFEHRALAVTTGRRAREHIVSKFSREAVAQIVEEQLRRIIAAARQRRLARVRKVDSLRHQGS